MDFSLTDQQEMVRQSARRFVDNEIAPVAAEYERRGPLSRGDAQMFLRKLSALGYLGAPLPEELGGSGLDYVSWALLMEELARGWAGLAMLAAQQFVSVERVAHLGSPDQKKRYLEDLLSGERIMAHCYSEPNVGSDLSSLETTATKDGDVWVINGTKTHITSGGIADMADVLAVTQKEKQARGTALFLVEKDISPFTCSEIAKLGLRATSSAEVSFQDCRVPLENAMETGAGEGYKQTLILFTNTRCVMAAMCVGIAQAAIEASVSYAHERVQFGRPIASFQLVQSLISDMVIETEAARLLTHRAFDLAGRGAIVQSEAAMAKAFAQQVGVKVTSRAIEIHGAYGLYDEYPVERYFRDAKTMTHPDGTLEIMKLVVGRKVLGVSALRG